MLTTRRVGNTSLQQMYSVGVRPENKHVVVAKGVISPRPAYEPIAADHKNQNAKLTPYIEQHVNVSGTLLEKGGITGIAIKTVEPAE